MPSYYRSILMNEKPSALEMRLGGSFLKTVDEWRRKQKGLPSRADKRGEDGLGGIGSRIRFDFLEDRAVMVLATVVRFAVEVEEPLEAENAALRYQLIVLRRKVIASASPTAIACSLSSCIDGFRR